MYIQWSFNDATHEVQIRLFNFETKMKPARGTQT